LRTGAAFVAGLVLGAAGAWLVATRARLPVVATPTAGASMAPAAPATTSPPADTARGLTPSPGLAFPTAPAPAGPELGTSGAPSEPPLAPGAWATSPEPEAPLGTRASSIPGDSTDGLLTPKSLAAPADAPAVPSVGDLDRLRARQLLLPVQGYDLHQLRDNFAEKRGGRVHEAIDMAASRGTSVLAVDDGVVKKLFTSAAGGLTVYEFDTEGSYAYYYAHLDRYAEGLREGQAVRKGDRLGYVGTSGNAPPDTPHLHFTIFKLLPTRRWWEGTPINPYPLWALRR
jgi:murein DD-endopeptidase MepM/ murein hydrolase activator NlpD